MNHVAVTKREWVNRRRVFISELVANFSRNGLVDEENGLMVGTNEWYASQVIKKFGDELDPDGRPILPKGYYVKGEISGRAFATDYYELKKKYDATIEKNLATIRDAKTADLERLADKLLAEIYEGERISHKLGHIEQLLKINEQIFKLNGLNAPSKQLNANLNIDMTKLSRAQLDRLIAGEDASSVMSYADEEAEETEEIIEGEILEQ